MRIIDTIVSREGDNSAWANVVFVGAGGETVSVRLPCPFPSGGHVGRERITQKAIMILSGIAAHDGAQCRGEFQLSSRTGRFGVPLNAEEPEDG